MRTLIAYCIGVVIVRSAEQRKVSISRRLRDIPTVETHCYHDAVFIEPVWRDTGEEIRDSFVVEILIAAGTQNLEPKDVVP